MSGALNATTSNLTKPDPDDPTGKRRVRDAQATALLYQKRHTVEQAFTEWVWTDPARTRMLEDVYNTRFNRIHPREYDGSYLTFPGISTDIDLYDHQRNAVARILQSKEGTLVAHVVGAGKTFTGVAACHEAKRLSRATKPMIVVPNHLTEQWAKDYLTLYPDANILSMTEADGAGKGAARLGEGRGRRLGCGHRKAGHVPTHARQSRTPREVLHGARPKCSTASIPRKRSATTSPRRS